MVADVVVKGFDDVERIAVAQQHRAERAEVIDRRMPDDDGALCAPFGQWAHPQSGSPQPPPDLAAFAALPFLPALPPLAAAAAWRGLGVGMLVAMIMRVSAATASAVVGVMRVIVPMVM